MKQPESQNIDALIEAFLDGMLPPEDRSRVLDTAASDPEFAQQLMLARSIREALRSMPTETAPPDMVPFVLHQVRRDAGLSWLRQVRDWFMGVDLRPVLMTACLIGVIVAAGLLGRPEPQPAEPEVAQALEQIKWTLGVVSEVGEITAFHLREDVFEPHVVGHMRGAVQDVFESPVRRLQ